MIQRVTLLFKHWCESRCTTGEPGGEKKACLPQGQHAGGQFVNQMSYKNRTDCLHSHRGFQLKIIISPAINQALFIFLFLVTFKQKCEKNQRLIRLLWEFHSIQEGICQCWKDNIGGSEKMSFCHELLLAIVQK